MKIIKNGEIIRKKKRRHENEMKAKRENESVMKSMAKKAKI
jgi:hypothetical protein